MTATDYPQLASWLNARGATLLWSTEVDGCEARIEAWQLGNGRGVLVELYEEHGGWDIWTNFSGLDAGDALQNADVRCGYPSRECKAV